MNKEIFLTFDDGPDPETTPHVLTVLKEKGVQATFFCVAQRAEKNAEIFRKILADSHAVGNHSLDHHYFPFFRGEKYLKNWVESAEAKFLELSGRKTVGFRPPAGVVTPELVRALRKMNLPLVLWDRRFYDATWPWGISRALRSLSRTQPGDTVLLHDRQKPKNLSLFIKTLRGYIDAAQKLGFQFRTIERKENA